LQEEGRDRMKEGMWPHEVDREKEKEKGVRFREMHLGSEVWKLYVAYIGRGDRFCRR
jgi:hypothetical protein